jgi:putative phosphoesterase
MIYCQKPKGIRIVRIAILSDIHANLLALDAVLADAETQHVDGLTIAGDLITDGPDTAEVLKRVRSLNCPVIMGNREDYILRYRNGEKPAWDGSLQMAAVLWASKSISDADFRYISTLPEQVVVELEGGQSLRVVHGSPFSMYELLRPYQDMATVEKSALAVREPVLVFGHNHIQWSGMVHGRLLLNPGSVGVHFNRECKAEYAILTHEDRQFSAELRRVSYDFAALEQRLVTSGLMEAAPVWTMITFESVKDGQNYNLHFLDEAHRVVQEKGISPGLIPNHIWKQVAAKWWDHMGWGSCPQ